MGILKERLISAMRFLGKKGPVYLVSNSQAERVGRKKGI